MFFVSFFVALVGTSTAFTPVTTTTTTTTTTAPVCDKDLTEFTTGGTRVCCTDANWCCREVQGPTTANNFFASGSEGASGDGGAQYLNGGYMSYPTSDDNPGHKDCCDQAKEDGFIMSDNCEAYADTSDEE